MNTPQGPYNGGYQGGPPQGFPPAQGFPPPGGPGYPYVGPPAPPKSKTGLIVGLVVVAVLALAGAGFAFYGVYQRSTAPLPPLPPTIGPESSVEPSARPTTTTAPAPAPEIAKAREHAEKYIAAANAKDEAAAIALTCDKKIPGIGYTALAKEAPAVLLEKPRIVEGERLVLEALRHNNPSPFPLEMVLTDGHWCMY